MSFEPSFTGRAFLLRRKAGSILIYRSGRVVAEADALRAQGSITFEAISALDPVCDLRGTGQREGLPRTERQEVTHHA